AVGDGRDFGPPPEAIAVVHERLRTCFQRPARSRRVRLLKRRDEWAVLVQEKGVADEAEVTPHFRPLLGPEAVEDGPELPLDPPAAVVGQPAPRPLQPALLRVLVVDLAGMNLADEDTLRPGQRVGATRQLAFQPAQPDNQIR